MTVETDLAVRDAVRRAQQGHRAEALASLEALVTRVPDHPFGRLHLGLLLAAEGRYEEAKSHSEHACALRPDSAAFLLLRGRVCYDAEDYSAAEECFERAAKVSPQNDLAAGFRTLTAWAAGSDDACFALNPSALPDSTPFLARLLYLIERDLNGRHVEYVDPALRVPALERVQIAWMLWRAGGHLKAGRAQNALELAAMAQEMQPGHSGAVELQRAAQTALLGIARRRVEENPSDASLRLELAVLLADGESFEAATEQMAEADRLIREKGEAGALDRPEIHRLRARIAFGSGEMDAARQETEAGAEPGFSLVETLYLRGLTAMRQGDRRLSLEAFEGLTEKAFWAVPLRFREYRAWRRSGARLPPPSSAGT